MARYVPGDYVLSGGWHRRALHFPKQLSVKYYGQAPGDEPANVERGADAQRHVLRRGLGGGPMAKPHLVCRRPILQVFFVSCSGLQVMKHLTE